MERRGQAEPSFENLTRQLKTHVREDDTSDPKTREGETIADLRRKRVTGVSANVLIDSATDRDVADGTHLLHEGTSAAEGRARDVLADKEVDKDTNDL